MWRNLCANKLPAKTFLGGYAVVVAIGVFEGNNPDQFNATEPQPIGRLVTQATTTSSVTQMIGTTILK
ncbi:MAG: hypothetical protein K8T25_15285 [Planctomycetia bacterium]|nr:hypothetical protein [Planctomycetia bacterium]